MNDIFISYSRRDKVFTQKLHEALTAANRSVWADWEDIPASSDWFAEIKQGIEETDSVIFVLSPEWIKSRECRKEMDYAVQMGKRLFPILYIPVDPKDLPPELAKINWVYLRDTDDFLKGFQTLCSALDTDLDWIKTHTRIQVRALEWEKKKRDHSFVLRGSDLTEGEQFLAGAANKSPVPTALQSEYILASRTDATRRQRWTLTGVTIALMISIALAVATFIQREKAVKQSQIALARQLAAQAQSIYAGRSSNQMVAVLLSIQSMKLFPNSDAATFLVNNNLSAPLISRMAHTGPVTAAAFSPDGRYVVSASKDKTARVWETTTGIEIVRLTHEGVVNTIAFSPDGEYVASGSQDNTIRVWEAASGNEITHKTHDDAVYSVAFSPDGKYVASGGEDKTVRVWEIITGKEVARLPQDDVVYSVSFSPNGKYIASRGDYAVEIWEAGTGKKLASIVPVAGGLTSESLSPDSKYVAIGCVTCSARVFETITGNEVVSLTNGISVTPVVYSPNGKYIVSGNDVWDTTTWKIISSFDQDDGVDTVVFSPDSNYFVSAGNSTVRVREVETGKEIARMTHDGPVTSVAFSPDSKYVLSGSEDNTIRVWKSKSTQVSQKVDPNFIGYSTILSPNSQQAASFLSVNNASIWELATGNIISSITYGDQAFTLSFSPDGKLAVSGGDDGTVRIWDVTSGKEIIYMLHAGAVKAVDFSSNGKYVVSGSEDKTVSVWEVTTGKKISQMAHESAVTRVVFSPDSQYVASGSGDGIVRLWDPITGNEKAHMMLKGRAFEVSFVPNGKYLVASGVYDHTLHVLEISTNEEIVFVPNAPLNYDDSSWVVVYLSSDSRYLAAIDINNANYAIIWEIVTGKEVSRIAQNGISSIAFSPDSKYVVSGGGDRAVRLWESASGKEIKTMPHDHFVGSVVFSPDGKYVASASSDRAARVWDVTTSKEIARMTDDNMVTWITFSRDGKYIVSASLYGTIRAWAWRAEDLIANACASMPRNLTRAEWEQFIGDAMPYPTSQEKTTCPNLPIPSEQDVTQTVMQ